MSANSACQARPHTEPTEPHGHAAHTHPTGAGPWGADPRQTMRGSKRRGAPAHAPTHPRPHRHTQPAGPAAPRSATLTCHAGLGHPLHDGLHGAAQHSAAGAERGQRRRPAAAAAPRGQRPLAHRRNRRSLGTAAGGNSTGDGQVPKGQVPKGQV